MYFICAFPFFVVDQQPDDDFVSWKRLQISFLNKIVEHCNNYTSFYDHDKLPQSNGYIE